MWHQFAAGGTDFTTGEYDIECHCGWKAVRRSRKAIDAALQRHITAQSLKGMADD